MINKILIVTTIFLFINVLADNFMSEGDILKRNNNQRGVSTFVIKSDCQSKTGQACYKIDNKNPRYYSVVAGNLVLNQTLKDAYDLEQAQKASDEATTSVKQSERIADLKVCIDEITAETITDNKLKICVKKVIKEAIKTSLTVGEL